MMSAIVSHVLKDGRLRNLPVMLAMVFVFLAGAGMNSVAAEKDIPVPLPMAASWCVGHYKSEEQYGPDWQIEMIEKGHHLFFSINFPGRICGSYQVWERKPLDESYVKYCKHAVQKAAAKKLPICLVSTQWENALYNAPAYHNLPPEENACSVDLEGKVGGAVSPFGPVKLWRQLGQEWTDNAYMEALQEWYPDPPCVLMLSNNEATALNWKQAEKCKQYMEKYGAGKPDAFKQKVFGEGYIERYQAMFAGMREKAKKWGPKMIFIGYAYNGRTDFFTLERRFTPYIWDGTSMRAYHASYDQGLTDFTANSPQIAAMNQVMEKKWFRQMKPNCFWEISTWWDPQWVARMQKDLGAKAGALPVERYLGFVRWVMWLPKPKVMRDFTGWTTRRANHWEIYQQVVKAVDEVHNNSTLTEFWQYGRLVVNENIENPIHADIIDPTDIVPEEIKKKDFYRFFGLDTNMDPEKRSDRGRDVYEEGGPIEKQSAFRVFAQAQVLGVKPERRWLVYAHAPRGDEQDVEIKIPDYGSIKVNISQAGSFYAVKEKDKSVKPAL